MNPDHAKLESLAREICDSRNGVGHYDKAGTHKSHWRVKAAKMMGDAGSIWGLVSLLVSIRRLP